MTLRVPHRSHRWLQLVELGWQTVSVRDGVATMRELAFLRWGAPRPAWVGEGMTIATVT